MEHGGPFQPNGTWGVEQVPDAKTTYLPPKPVNWLVIGISTGAGLLLICVLIVILTTATWHIFLAVPVVLVVTYFIAAYWIAWRDNRKVSNDPPAEHVPQEDVWLNPPYK